MGQQQLSPLKNQISHPNLPKATIWTAETLVSYILRQVQDITGQPLTPEDIHIHLTNYLDTHALSQEATRKRSRSYELLHQEQNPMEEPIPAPCKPSEACLALEEKMEWLEQTEQDVRTNITEIMANQKPFKIRQTFRRLILELLKLDNLLLYVLHSEHSLEFHDFRQNFITEVQEEFRFQMVETLIRDGYQPDKTQQVLNMFELGAESQGKQGRYSWSVIKQSKMSFCYASKKKAGYPQGGISPKLIQKIASIAMISTSEEEDSVIQNYSKHLLQILELLVNDCEIEACTGMGSVFTSMEEVEKDLAEREGRDEMLLLRIGGFQQLQFQLLERIRMYKKYVCEGDKIFMEFDESAELTFLSNNFCHPLLAQLPQLWEQKKLLVEKIFQDYKPITEFIKKAVQQKIKPNKLYELNFQTKVRVKLGKDGRIKRLHVILEELENSSTSSSNIYTSSSTKIVSEGSSEKNSFKDLPDKGEEKERQPSTLVKNLEKDNPGIINQGWINLFIKDHHLSRKNTYFKNKPGKGYTVRRSISLNEDPFSPTESDEPKDNLHHLNIDSIDLNLLELEEELLEPLVMKVFRKLQHFHSEHVNQQYFLNFLTDVHNGYQVHNNPFHNFTHGVNVMHTCYLLTNSGKNRQLLSPSKIFTIVFSGLCHDVGHTGFNNLFQIATGSKKAVTYNDSSPLENYHAAYTFELLKKPENNFLKDLSPEEVKQFRKTVINNILFTDIKEHFPLLKKFNTLIKDEIPKNDEYISILSAMIVHTADFGGSAKQFEVCKAWSLKVNLEFSNQYKQEGELGLPQTPFMKDLTGIATLSKNEAGFLKIIVFPLYEAMDEFCGNDQKVRKLRDYAEYNIKKWEKIHTESQSEEKKESEAQKQ